MTSARPSELLAVPESWQGSTDDRAAIPGCTQVQEVAGVRVYTITGVPYLSTGTVLRLSPWGRLEHIPPEKLEYGRARGTFVDECCRLVDADALDWEGTPWTQTLCGLPFNARPYVEAYAEWITGMEILAVEELVLADDCRTFGYLDRRIVHPERGITVLDIKTSKILSDRERMQNASYTTPATEACLLLQLTNKGKAVEHWMPNYRVYRDRFRAFAHEAHLWIAQQVARR